MKKKADSDEPISQIQNVVKKNQEPVCKGIVQLDDSFILISVLSKFSRTRRRIKNTKTLLKKAKDNAPLNY